MHQLLLIIILQLKGNFLKDKICNRKSIKNSITTNNFAKKEMVFLKRNIVSSLDDRKFVKDQDPSDYLNKIHSHKTRLRHSTNYGRVKNLEEALNMHSLSHRSRSSQILSLKPTVEPINLDKENRTLEVNSLGAPSSRMDATNLLEYMDGQVHNIKSDKSTSRVDKIHATQIIYNIVHFVSNILGMEGANQTG